MGCRSCQERRKKAAEQAKYGLPQALKARITGTVEFSSVETQKSRFETCKKCKHFFKITRTCLVCKCFLNEKIKHEKSKCPLGKW